MPIPTFGPKAGQNIPESEASGYYIQYGQGVPFQSAFKASPPEYQAEDAYNRTVQQYTEAGLTPPSRDQYEQSERDRMARPSYQAGQAFREQERQRREAERVNPITSEGLYNAAKGAGVSPWGTVFNQQAFGGSNLNLSGIQLGNQDQARNEQAKVIQALQAQARGDMNSLGQQQLAQGFQQAGAQQRSLGSSIRGTGGGAGLRAGAIGAADTQRGFVGQQEMLKLQEQQAAQAMLAQLLAQQQAQDVGLAGSMASGSLANQQLNQEMERFYGGQALGQLVRDYQYGSDLGRANLGFDLESRDLEQLQRNRVISGIGTGVATAANAFGEEEKKRVKSPQDSEVANA